MIQLLLQSHAFRPQERRSNLSTIDGQGLFRPHWWYHGGLCGKVCSYIDLMNINVLARPNRQYDPLGPVS